MAYTPTNWECGDVVTAEKLNKLEEAVENLSLLIESLDGRVTALEEASQSA